VSETRTLYLLRHAKSSWDQPGLADHERRLAERGQQALTVLARYAEQHEINPDLILCSSSVRTRQTLQGVLPGHGALIEHDLFFAGQDRLLDRLRQVDSELSSVMIVGHNPALQMLTLKLAGRERADRASGSEGLDDIRRKLPTGSLVTLSFDASWAELGPGAAALVDYARPKALLHEKL
jgi:phosphohistidine phosphatase